MQNDHNEMILEEGAVPRDRLVSSLKEYSLSYEQNQLIKGDGLVAVAYQVLRRVRRFDFVLGCLIATFVLLAIRGVVVSDGYVVSLVLAGVTTAWLLRRRKKKQIVQQSLEDYVAADLHLPQGTDDLEYQIRVGYRLEYRELQALKSGDYDLAASLIVARFEENIRDVTKFGWRVCAPGLVLFVSSLFTKIPISDGILLGLLPSTVLACGFMANVAYDLGAISKTRRLNAEFAETQRALHDPSLSE